MKMDSYHHLSLCFTILVSMLLHKVGGAAKPSLPCYRGDNYNETLDNTIHLSDVVLAGRIVSVEKGEFGTHSATVSYYYSYKSDGLLRRIVLWRTEVTNFVPAPQVGMLGIFFLFREPNMQLSLFCMASIPTLVEYSQGMSYEAILGHISEVGANDTKKNHAMALPYPDPCDPELNPCGSGAYCSVTNTLPHLTTRCSCLTGFYKDHTSGACIPRTDEAATLHCPYCGHDARCWLSTSVVESPEQVVMQTQCSCQHFHCSEVGLQAAYICGSDGNSYAGVCQMRLEACKQRKEIHLLYSGRCRSSVPQACMGLGQPLATSAGLLHCSSCPAGHFCYSTSYYNICCPVQVPNFIPVSGVSKDPIPTTISSATPSPPTFKCGSGSGDGGSGSSPYHDSESSGSGSDTEYGC